MKQATKKQVISEFEKKVVEAIIATYPEDIFLPVSDDKKAKNDVLAQALRDMSPSISKIVSQLLDDIISSTYDTAYEKGVRDAMGRIDSYIKHIPEEVMELNKNLDSRTQQDMYNQSVGMLKARDSLRLALSELLKIKKLKI